MDKNPKWNKFVAQWKKSGMTTDEATKIFGWWYDNKNWVRFVDMWKRFGLTSKEASEVLDKNWLEKNYTIAYGNIWKDKENRKDFIEWVDYVYEYMRYSEIRWRSACLELCETQDVQTKKMLVLLKVPGSVVHGSINITPVTFAKLVGQWRQEFIDRGWLDEFDKPQIIIKRIEKTLRRAKLLKKKKK